MSVFLVAFCYLSTNTYECAWMYERKLVFISIFFLFFKFFITFSYNTPKEQNMEMDLRVRSTEFQQWCLVNFLNDFFFSFVHFHSLYWLFGLVVGLYVYLDDIPILCFYLQLIIPRFFLHIFTAWIITHYTICILFLLNIFGSQ